MTPKNHYLGQGTMPYGCKRINENRILGLPEYTNLYIEKGVELDSETREWLLDCKLRVFWILNTNK